MCCDGRGRRIDTALRVETNQTVGFVDDNIRRTVLQAHIPVGQTQGMPCHGLERCLAARQRKVQGVGDRVDTTALVEQENIGGMRSIAGTRDDSAGQHAST